MAAGDLALYTEASDGSTISTSPAFRVYTTTVQEDSIFTIDSSSEQVDCSEAGHYLVGASECMVKSNQLNPSRAEIQVNLRLNGTTNLKGGRGTGYWREANLYDACYVSVCTIVNLSANDDLGIRSQRTDTEGTDGATVRETATAKPSFWLLKLDDSWDYIDLGRVTSNPSATDGSGTWAALPWNLQNEADSSWTHSTSTNPEDITFDGGETRRVLIATNIQSTTSATSRVLMEMRITVNGTEVPGTRTTAYLRGAFGCQNATCVWAGIVELDDGDVVNVEYRDNDNTGNTWTPAANGLSFTAVVLPNDDANFNHVFRAYEATGGHAADVDGELSFDTTEFEDSESFDHNPGGSSDTDVEMQADGWVALFASGYCDTTSTRDTDRLGHSLEWHVNGTHVGYGIGGAYNRGDDGAGETLSAGGPFHCTLANVSSGDIIVSHHHNYGNGSDSTVDWQASGQSISGFHVGTFFPLLKNRDDTEQVSEDVQDRLGIVKAVDSTVELSEANGTSMGLVRSADSTVQVSETNVRARYFKVDETENVSDLAVRSWTINRSVSETEQISESADDQTGILAAVDDTVEVSDDVQSFQYRSVRFSSKTDGTVAGAAAASSSEGGPQRAQ